MSVSVLLFVYVVFVVVVVVVVVAAVCDDVAPTAEGVKDMENQLNTVIEESLKIGHKLHKGTPSPPPPPQFMTNIDTTDNTQIDGHE